MVWLGVLLLPVMTAGGGSPGEIVDVVMMSVQAGTKTGMMVFSNTLIGKLLSLFVLFLHQSESSQANQNTGLKIRFLHPFVVHPPIPTNPSIVSCTMNRSGT